MIRDRFLEFFLSCLSMMLPFVSWLSFLQGHREEEIFKKHDRNQESFTYRIVSLILFEWQSHEGDIVYSSMIEQVQVFRVKVQREDKTSN